MKKLFKHKSVRSALITVCMTAFMSLLYFSNVFDFIENKVYDSLTKATADTFAPSDDIIVVLLDQDSIDWAQETFGWSWPWPRKAYGDVVRFFADGGANSVAFDVMYTEPSSYGEADDNDFATAAEQFSGVVHTVFLSEEFGNSQSWPTDINVPFLEASGFSDKVFAEHYPQHPALYPIPKLRSSAGVMGNITSSFDSDRIIRRANLFYPIEGRAVPSLGLASLLAREGKNEPITYNEKTKTVTLMGTDIPVDNQYKPYIRFCGELDRYIPYSARTILESWYAVQNGEEPLLSPHDFANTYVFFGFYAPGLFDICTTPISSTYPGMGVHITLLDNFLQGNFIRKLPMSSSFLLIFLTTLATAFASLLIEHIPFVKRHASIFTALSVLAIIAILIAVAYNLFVAGLWIPLITPIASVLLTYVEALAIDYAFEGKQKTYLKSAFKQYLSPVVIEELIAHPDRLKLGGERREISIFFSDVQGFTSISERLSPEALTALLNDYLSAMSDVILESGGTIDKYEGDAIIAFWNAPIQQDDHARRALEVAMKCQKVLAEMRPKLAERAGTGMYMRIGLNTGMAVVGNMGSHNRFDYTMLGDAVNLAARLEGQNKQFGTYIMCTEAMKNAAVEHGCAKHFRELARLAVVGKKEAVTVFQPLEPEEYEVLKEYLPIFDEARTMFYEGEVEKAMKVFAKIQDHDKPAYFYTQKCAKLLESGIENHPKGIWVADTK